MPSCLTEPAIVRLIIVPPFLDRADLPLKRVRQRMITATLEYCETCKTDTPRCQYYPKGRSRRHGKCLECDRKDPRNPAGFKRKDARYCYECDRSHNLAVAEGQSG